MRTTVTLFSRRAFLQAPTALALSGFVAATEAQPGKELWTDVPGPVKVIDAHSHLYHHSRPTWAEADRKVIEAADKLGIDQFCCSILTPRRPASAEGFRDCNRWVGRRDEAIPGPGAGLLLRQPRPPARGPR